MKNTVDVLLAFEPPAIKAQEAVKLLLTPVGSEASSKAGMHYTQR